MIKKQYMYLQKKSLILVGFIAVGITLMNACSKNATESTASTDFELIQQKILTPSCATPSCHSSTSDATYPQHGLVLAAGQAYDNLLNKLPKNPNAVADGMSLVKSSNSAKSFLFHKVECSGGHHSSSYGATMPLGGTPLSGGQIEFIKRWIDAGALRTGKLIDSRLMDDNVPCDQTFTPLAVPAAGTGYQMKIDKFAVQPNFEREVFVRRAIGNTQEVLINRMQIKGRPNSHHFVLYAFRNSAFLPPLNELRDLRNPDNTINLPVYATISNEVFLFGGTDVNQDYTFPAGVALKVPANYTVDLNGHYFNRTNNYVFGENYLNVYTTPASNVTKFAESIDFKNTDINIPAGQIQTFTKNFTFGTPTKVFMLTSHYHKLGTKFQIKIFGGPRDGELIYENTDWQHPIVKNFPTPISLQAGEGLTSVVTYNNNTTKNVSWGLTSEDEMNIIFGYFY
jgi:Copper type II ascorbate-dependent monooxygenase, C-terminal domain